MIFKLDISAGPSETKEKDKEKKTVNLKLSQNSDNMSKKSDFALNATEKQALDRFHKSWPLRFVPDSMKPYAELLRIHKPAGVAMFYFPCLYGTFLVGALGWKPDLKSMVLVNMQLLLLSFLMRGALCTWNDVLDQDLDRQVARTRIRPLARKAVSTTNALIFTAVQAVLVWLCLNDLPGKCLTYALPFLALHVFYPFSKRLTNHPQFILGIAHSSGVFISFPALGQKLSIQAEYNTNFISAVAMSLAILFWTLLNDTIYAAQDIEDDKKAGIGSTMIAWEGQAKNILRGLALLTVVALAVVSTILKYNSPFGGAIYTALTVVGTAAGLWLMVEGVNLEDPASCGWWFNQGNVLVGMAIGSGLVGEYLASAL